MAVVHGPAARLLTGWYLDMDVLALRSFVDLEYRASVVVGRQVAEAAVYGPHLTAVELSSTAVLGAVRGSRFMARYARLAAARYDPDC